MASAASTIAPVNVTGKQHAVQGDFLYLYMGTDNSVGPLSDQSLFLDQQGQLVYKWVLRRAGAPAQLCGAATLHMACALAASHWWLSSDLCFVNHILQGVQ